MHAVSAILFVIAVGVELASAGGGSWSYDDSHGTGPASWKKEFPSCGGSKQSPINIEGRSAELATFEDINLVGYDGPIASNLYYTVKNNGHTVQLDVPSDRAPSISGGDLHSGTYRLAQFHVHWGGDNSVGSEHTVDGRFYPLEIHLVHYNTKYPNVSAALDHKDGLAVLGVFAEVGDSRHEELQKFIDAFSHVIDADTSYEIKGFPLKKLLPADIKEFTRYEGSLTTPTCSEVVTWTVFKKPITISQTQLNQFRTLNHSKGGVHHEPLVNNYRPVQPVGNRRVKRTYSVTASGSDAHRLPVAVSFLYAVAIGVTVAVLRQ